VSIGIAFNKRFGAGLFAGEGLSSWSGFRVTAGAFVHAGVEP